MNMMKTELLPVCPESIDKAAGLLAQGQVVAIPTETVYGLAANAGDEAAVQRIFKAKGRPQDNPLIVHISDISMLERVAAIVPQNAYRLAEAFWPGPLTMVLPMGRLIAPAVSAGLKTVGVRLPAHPGARALIDKSRMPLAAPSANRSGRPSPTTASHVLKDMDGRIPLILDGGDCPVGLESTVITLVGWPTVLRPGFVTPAQLSEVLGEQVALSPGIELPVEPEETPASPGMKYRHYAPKAEITTVEGSFEAYRALLAEKAAAAPKGAVYALCFDEDLPHLGGVQAVAYGRQADVASQAAGLFGALRRLDEVGAETAYARLPAPAGVGLAVRNRLLRAAGFRQIRLADDDKK